MMLPQLGMFGGVPAPMNDKIASVIIADAQTYVACTSSGATVFGSMWRTSMRGVVVPAGRHHVVFRFAPFSLDNLTNALKTALRRRHEER